MAKQSTVWLSDRGEVCRSEKDAHLADASNAIDDFVEKNWTGPSSGRELVHVFLTEHHTELRLLLADYKNAVDARRKEVNDQ